MTTHELKTDPVVFQAVASGLKSYEIRLNDRNFRVGDRILLCETYHTGEDMKHGAPLKYTGNKIAADIRHILHGPIYGLMEGWCILSIGLVLIHIERVQPC
ncbi:DUF3850 domain-containing protein [Solidesulfovibrio alcoholivorans]|uniref:DUF3850 domain-containing protein n=1 Tax=Solidesulfovibrio alcoholivorans TaxID=81406 RepID=UPI000495AC4A|nr:DUF3850 domain-containing protein [Solidesulfovibrio alcoholivorans]